MFDLTDAARAVHESGFPGRDVLMDACVVRFSTRESYNDNGKCQWWANPNHDL